MDSIPFIFSVWLLLKLCLSSGSRPLKSMGRVGISNFFSMFKSYHYVCVLTFKISFFLLNSCMERLDGGWLERSIPYFLRVFWGFVLKTILGLRIIKATDGFILLFKKTEPYGFFPLSYAKTPEQITMYNKWVFFSLMRMDY